MYFAYGSNMSSKCLCSRIPSAKSIGLSYLKDKKVVFNKRSVDNSGKTNLVDSFGDVTWGVMYEIDAKDLHTLDKIEGNYDRVIVQVWRPNGEIVKAVSYISTDLTVEAVAYDWYKEQVLSGAREHNLPQDYIAYLEQLLSKPDKTHPEMAG